MQWDDLGVAGENTCTLSTKNAPTMAISSEAALLLNYKSKFNVLKQDHNMSKIPVCLGFLSDQSL